LQISVKNYKNDVEQEQVCCKLKWNGCAKN